MRMSGVQIPSPPPFPVQRASGVGPESTEGIDRRLVARISVRVALAFLFIGGALFASAGRLDWPRGWAFFALMAFTGAVNFAIVGALNPAVIRARTEFHKGTKRFDRFFFLLYVPAYLAVLVVAGLDARFGWSALGTGAFAAGAALHLLGNVPIVWALSVNPYLEATVRIQTDRGHRVVTTGPYAIVRHPMYAGVILMLSGWPLLLGSCWLYIPVAAIDALVVLRMLLEDRTLRRELPGYAEYAERTRRRLLPGVW